MAEYESLLARQQRIMLRAATRSTAPQGRQRPTQREIFEPAFQSAPTERLRGGRVRRTRQVRLASAATRRTATRARSRGVGDLSRRADRTAALATARNHST